MPIQPYKVNVSLRSGDAASPTTVFLVTEGFDEYWDAAERISTLLGEEFDRLLSSREWDEVSTREIGDKFDDAISSVDFWELGSSGTVSFGAFTFSLTPAVVPEEWKGQS